MYSAPDFVKISVQHTNAFASDPDPCTPTWEMSKWEYQPDCKKLVFVDEMPGMTYACYVNLNEPG